MARMFPERLKPSVREDASRAAEVRVYDALARDAPDGWRVIYSVPWLSRGPGADGLREGEADFVIVHPQCGVLVLEVKGGGIERDASSGTWWSTDGEGARHEIHDPYAQASRSKHALLAKLRELPALRDSWLPMAHGVVFPSLGRPDARFGVHAPPEVTITGDDLHRIAARIEEVFAAFASEASFDAAAAEAIEHALAPSVSLRAPLAVAAREADRRLVELTEEQLSVLDVLGRARRVEVSGPAGSGKSVVAAEQARRLARQGFRTLLVCFNRPLADVLAPQLRDEPDLHVHTFHDLCKHFGVEAGLLEPGYLDDPPADYFDRLPEVLLEALEARPDLRFDAVVVDEGQDFEADWWTHLELAMRGDDPVLYVFHDGGQRLKEGTASLPPNLFPASLPKNVRNTKAIHRLARRFGPSMARDAEGPEGRAVEFVELAEDAALVPALSRVLHRLVRDEQFRAEEIAVLTGRGQASTALNGVSQVGAQKCGPLPVLPGIVALDTIRRFKGLDSRAVVLVELDHALGDDELLYVGITRARTHLVVLGAAETLAHLRGG